jgi:hypothetical protein
MTRRHDHLPLSAGAGGSRDAGAIVCQVGPAIGGETFVRQEGHPDRREPDRADVKQPPKHGRGAATPTPASPAVGRRASSATKGNVVIDQGTDLGAVLTAQCRRPPDTLIQGEKAAFYADKAYDSQARRRVLTEAGVVDALMYRRHPRRRQPAWQKCSDWRLVR